MDAKLVPTLEIDVPDVSIGGSSGVDLVSGARQFRNEEHGNHAACAQPPLPVKSFVKSIDQKLEYKSGSLVPVHLDHRTTDLFVVGSNMESVDQVHEQTANTEVVGSLDEQVDQELVTDLVKHQEHRAANDLHDFGTNMEGGEEVHDQAANTEVLGSLHELEVDQELVSDSEKHLDNRATNYLDDVDTIMEDFGEVPDQAANVEIVGSLNPTRDEIHSEHRTINDLRDVGTNMDDVEEVHDQSANAEVIGSQNEREVEEELDSDSENHLEHRTPTDFHDVEEVHDQSANTEVIGSQNEREVEELDSDPENHLEHRTTNDVHDFGTNMDNVEEVHDQSVNTEVTGSPNEREVDEELDSDSENHIEHRTTNDYHDVGTKIEDVEEVNIQATNTRVVDLPKQGLDQELVLDSEKHLEYRSTNDHDVGIYMEDVEEVNEEVSNNEVVGSPDEQEVHQELVSYSAKPRSKEEKNVKHSSSKPGNLVKDCLIRYQLPPDNDSELAVFDLVWGKVKSHPWWPGQIFHPSDSSEKAMKYYKKDCYLVAYFGDRTFAWNDASVLKPFRNHFSQAERQNKSEAFQNAVSCALEEVTRRVELGLACSCVSDDAFDKIKYQIVENSGIREESCKREGVDRSTGGDSFQPDKLTEYVKALAVFPTSGFDRLELVIAKAQLQAFNQLRGDALPEFQYYDGLVDYDTDKLPGNQGLSDDNEPATGVDGKKGPHKRKHNLKDIVYQRRKEKSVTDLMGESVYYLDGEFDSHEEDDIFLAPLSAGSKRKAGDFLTDDFTAPQSTKTISVAKVSHKASPNPQQSFKVGECIRRVASQMTGSSIIVKDSNEESNKHLGDDADEVLETHKDSLTESTPVPADPSSLDEMLSQLYLSAQNPMKRYSFFGVIIRFFTEFRNVAVTTQRQKMRKGSCRKKKSSVPAVGSSENFEFDDRTDSYWKDMVIQDNVEAKPARRGRKRKDERPSGDHQKPPQRKPRKYSRKQYHIDNHESVPAAVPELPTGDEKRMDLPTELMLNFGEMSSIPSEVSLNKMFKRFGPLKESETEVDMQSNRARVVFKKRSDAEVAYSSAAMFNIFGSTAVNYQLNYAPSVSFKSPPLALTNGKEDAS